MFVKICGITNRDDALAAVDAGARALGFIFYPASPRHITAAQLEPWISEIPPEIWKVGVFVDEAPELIERIGVQLRLDIAQLHGSETPDHHPQGIRVWKAFRVKDGNVSVPDYPAAEAILIDGCNFDWGRTAHLARPLILAGGLDENNVRDRIQRACRAAPLQSRFSKTTVVQNRDREGAATESEGAETNREGSVTGISGLWGIDVASGIESSPGRKDHARMKRFIEAALSS